VPEPPVVPEPVVPATPKPVLPEPPKPVEPEPPKPVAPEPPKPVAPAELTEDQAIARARTIGRQRWPEQVKAWPAGLPVEIVDEKPAVTRTGDRWQLVFELGDPAHGGARVTVLLDASGQEVSTRCEWGKKK